MENLTARELHVLKTIVLIESEERENYLDVSLKDLYGKLNVLWSEARKAEREAAQ